MKRRIFWYPIRHMEYWKVKNARNRSIFRSFEIKKFCQNHWPHSLAFCYVFLPTIKLVTFCETVYLLVHLRTEWQWRAALQNLLTLLSLWLPFNWRIGSFFFFLSLSHALFVLFSFSLFFSFLSLPSTFLLTLSPKEDRALLLSER